MTWTFEWIGIDAETFNDEHDQMSGALVLLWHVTALLVSVKGN